MKTFSVAGIKAQQLSRATSETAVLFHPQAITEALRNKGFSNFFILSTCNRFEIYSNQTPAIQLALTALQNHLPALQLFEMQAYQYVGEEALLHLFRVTSGIDSNLLGDYEISGQVKNAAKAAKELNCLGGELERMVNSALSASKAVKTQTGICRGKVSYAAAAQKLAASKYPSLKGVPVLIYGLGKIGRNLLQFLFRYTDADNVTLCNRTTKHIEDCLEKYDVEFLHRDDMDAALGNYKILFVCTGAQAYTVTASQVAGSGLQYVFDLGFPANADPAIAELQGVGLYNMQALEKVFEETIEQRKAELPLANSILLQHVALFRDAAYRRSQYVADMAAAANKVAPQPLLKEAFVI